MDTENIKNIVAIILTIVFTLCVAVIVSINSVYSQIPIIFSCAILAFIIQWIAFVPAFFLQTEHFYDLVGSITYISILTFLIFSVDNLDARGLILCSLIGIWTIRLGTFLYRRIREDGYDRRLIKLKSKATSFLVAWTTQGCWVFLTMIAAITAITSGTKIAMGATGFIGILIWLIGFYIETIADNQKRRFRDNPENSGKFIKSGLWEWSRHPNYFGELWTGIAIIALPALNSWQLAALISPIFVYLLLTKLSGIPMLERSALERWGENHEYQIYLANTPTLFPKRPSRKNS